MPDSNTGTGRLVRCELCGRTDACTAEDLLQFTRSGWPKCCGAVMAYYASAPPPTDLADDTKIDRPTLPPT